MSTEHPLVSIVIPAYNYARYLDEAIESVLSQSYKDIELIVLDDGSTDNTRKVLEKYTGRFYWETQKNLGQSETLNKGWRMSKGEILAYLSADDVLFPDAVATSVEWLLGHPDVVLTYCDYELIGPDAAPLRRVNAPDFDYREMVVKFVCPPGPGAFFRRSAFETTGLWDGSLRLSPDYDYWLRLGLLGKFLRIPGVLAGFRVHGGSQSFAAVDDQRSDEYVRVISRYYDSQLVPVGLLADEQEALSNAYIAAARSHLRSGRYSKGLARLWRGISLYPRNLLASRTYKFVAHGLFNHLRYRNV
jgi:glycosyltransferase involved in cell wall biosynthesis